MDTSATTLEEFASLLRSAIIFGIIGLVMVAAAVVYFASSASAEREKICDVVVEAVRGNSEALIATFNTNGDRTVQEQERFDELVSQYRNRVDSVLAPCE